MASFADQSYVKKAQWTAVTTATHKPTTKALSDQTRVSQRKTQEFLSPLMNARLARPAQLIRQLHTAPPVLSRPRSRHIRTMTTGTFKYLDPATITQSDEPFVKPWAKVDVDQTSFSRTERRRSVSDVRAAPGGFSAFGTDVSGFAVHHAPAREKAFTDDRAVREGYYAEVEALLREKLAGVKKVVIFDHTVRKHDKASARQPVQQVHVDQTPRAAEARVRRHVPDAAEAQALLRGRYQIVNVWRPIAHPASDFPLAVVDWRTTRPEDLVKVDLLYPKRKQNGAEGREDDDDDDDRGKEVLPDPESVTSTEGYEVRGETFSVQPSDRHRFYYVKDMTPDEAMFIKCFDSFSQGRPGGREGVADYTPHTAFVDPATPPDAKGRQSIEVRCLVFYE